MTDPTTKAQREAEKLDDKISRVLHEALLTSFDYLAVHLVRENITPESGEA